MYIRSCSLVTNDQPKAERARTVSEGARGGHAEPSKSVKEHRYANRAKRALVETNFWVGAFLDGATLVPMLSPNVATRLFGIADRSADSGFRYAMLVGAALMAGWTCLLVWAAQRPIERRAVAMLTGFPVLAGLLFSSGFAIATGFMEKADILPTLVLQALLGMSFVGSYFASSPNR